MRLYLPLLFLSLFLLQARGQSFKIINSQSHITVNASDIFYLGTTASGETDQGYLVINISNAEQTFSVRRYDDQLNTVTAGDAAAASFCTGDNCFVPAISTATFALAPTDTMLFMTNFKEASAVGESAIRYKISNPSLAESLQWTMKYTQTVGIKNNTAFAAGISEVYPNPASSQAFIDLKTQQAQNNMVLSTFNCAGQLMRSEKINVPAGQNKIPVAIDNLTAGVYFVSLQAGAAVVTKKLVVSTN